jgi:hypothetical protein
VGKPLKIILFCSFVKRFVTGASDLDVLVVTGTIAAGDDFVRSEQVCFHALQAEKKAIKALLLCRGIEFPLTHDIEEPLEIAEKGT